MAANTPMMKQYNLIKNRHKDCILFFRLGDFYEMFNDDAYLASKELDLVLTTRDRNKENPDDRTPMCGVPYHSCEAYISRLISKGYKVAICEQTEDPALAKGLVTRDVIRVITPGTVTESSMLDEKCSNYVCSVCIDPSGAGISFADVSTGEFCAGSFDENAQEHIKNELARFSPREAILSAGAFQEQWLRDFLHETLGCLITEKAELYDFLASAARVCEHFSSPDTDSLGLGETPAAVCAAGSLLSYLHETQMTELTHINSLSLLGFGQYMELDLTARRSLELTETMRTHEKKGSLLWVLDHTKTPMGSRMLRSWLERVLLSPAQIKKRLDAVGELVSFTENRGEVMLELQGVGDIERLISRISCGNANCRDLRALASSLSPLPEIKLLLKDAKSSLLSSLVSLDALEDIRKLINKAIYDEPPFSVREGGMFRDGYNEQIDTLRSLVKNSRELIANIERSEREKTGIKKLRVGYNRVFGYYIEIPRSGSSLVPENYIRKQTLANNERYITQELKELEDAILSAGDKLSSLEYELFTELTSRIANDVERVQKTASMCAQIDVLCSLADVAAKNGYCMPEVDLSRTIDIKDGRHPVVEHAMKSGLFVPNDTYLDCAESRCAIITGPNMAGKSTYMRQTALIVLMAQLGSFVPAKSAHIGIVDRIFTRIGASDDLAGGRSTFMVEMTEVADILKSASSKSLIILDEIGRGTSTYDGLAIARAVLEYCANKKRLGAKTMFSTHYHELTELQNELEGVKNYNIAAKKRGDEIIFLRRIVLGGADESYGIEVAKLAGVPDEVIKKAKLNLAEIEAQQPVMPTVKTENAGKAQQVSFEDDMGSKLIEQLRSTDINTLTPIEAMNLLYELKKRYCIN